MVVEAVEVALAKSRGKGKASFLPNSKRKRAESSVKEDPKKKLLGSTMQTMEKAKV